MPFKGLPKITSENDIYRIGTLCTAKAIHDTQNSYSPYMLNLFPLHKAVITSFTDPVSTLARVEVEKIVDFHGLTEEELQPHDLVIFKFLN